MSNGKNWWAIYFIEAKGENLDFVIENYTDKNEFDYEIKNNDRILQSEKITVEKGEKKNISVDSDPGGRIVITVSNGENKKEIYKNL